MATRRGPGPGSEPRRPGGTLMSANDSDEVLTELVFLQGRLLRELKRGERGTVAREGCVASVEKVRGAFVWSVSRERGGLVIARGEAFLAFSAATAAAEALVIATRG